VETQDHGGAEKPEEYVELEDLLFHLSESTH
jgi:hypothetical protein